MHANKNCQNEKSKKKFCFPVLLFFFEIRNSKKEKSQRWLLLCLQIMSFDATVWATNARVEKMKS